MSVADADVVSEPKSWADLRAKGHSIWRVGPGWAYARLVYWSQQWSFLKILDAAGKFVIVVAIVQWFAESGDRTKDRHYRAWQIVNSARGATGDGGRRDALQDLNDDGVSLANAPLSGAYLLEVRLDHATLSGASLSDANLLGAGLASANLLSADLTESNLASAHLRRADLTSAKLVNANLIGANLQEATIHSTDLTGANLQGATLYRADMDRDALDKALLCKTVMPDGNISNRDCPAQDAAPPNITPRP